MSEKIEIPKLGYLTVLLLAKVKIADRKFIEDVIELHEMGKDVEQIMFSLNLPYEEPR